MKSVRRIFTYSHIRRTSYIINLNNEEYINLPNLLNQWDFFKKKQKKNRIKRFSEYYEFVLFPFLWRIVGHNLRNDFRNLPLFGFW